MIDNNSAYMTTILENTSDAIYVFDNHWRFIYMNTAAIRYWGREKNELLGKCLWKEYPMDIGNIFYKKYHEAIRERVEVSFETYAIVQNKWVQVRARPIEEGLIVYILDITKLKELEFKYKYETKKLNQIIDSCPMAIYEVDCEGRLVNGNKGFRDIFFPKCTIEQLIGKGAAFLKESTGLDWVDSPSYQAVKGNVIKDLPFTFCGRKVLINALPTRDYKGEINGSLTIAQDITDYENERSENARMLAKLDRLNLVGEMAAGVAHEIRNPLTVVKGYLQFLSHKVSNSMAEQFETILSELERVEQLITDFLSLAINKATEQELQDLDSIIRKIKPLIITEAVSKGIDLKLNLAEDLPDLSFDKKEIKQLVLNLVRNGMEAMTKQGMLTIETKYRDDKICLCISDSGCGIPKNLREKIFDPFFTTKDSGTGLGLSVCASIVERHNGTIEVQSEEGKGTKFIINFAKV